MDEVDARRRRACLRTALTTSTTGPQVRLVQYFGVAKTTTNGFFARERLRDRDAIELGVGLRRGRQLLQRRVRERRRVRGERRCTHVRGIASRVDDDVAHGLDLATPDGLGEDPVLARLVELQVRDEHVLHLARLRRRYPGRRPARTCAIVSANGFAFRSSASQTFAVGRVTTRPWPSTTRNVNRTEPGPKSDVPGTIATSSPGARQSASSVGDVSTPT